MCILDVNLVYEGFKEVELGAQSLSVGACLGLIRGGLLHTQNTVGRGGSSCFEHVIFIGGTNYISMVNCYLT